MPATSTLQPRADSTDPLLISSLDAVEGPNEFL
jgi:hypothetical protein